MPVADRPLEDRGCAIGCMCVLRYLNRPRIVPQGAV
jgi:hypothetical protein